MLELHTNELEEIERTIAASGWAVFLIKESEILEADNNIRKIDNLMVEECQLPSLDRQTSS